MTNRASPKDIEIILAIRGLQKMISDTETPDIIKILKEARKALIKIYSEDDKEKMKQIIAAVERMRGV